MSKALVVNLNAISNAHGNFTPAILSVVKDKRGKIESVTVYRAWRKQEDACQPIKSFCGDLDIHYSYGSTYKQLDRPKSGLVTAVPLKGERLVITSLAEAVKEANTIYRKDFPARQMYRWWFPKRDSKGRFLPGIEKPVDTRVIVA